MQRDPDIHAIHRDEHQQRLGCPSNPDLTLRVNRVDGRLVFDVADFGGSPHVRVLDTIDYLRYLHAVGCAADARMAEDRPSFIFQADDNPHSFASFSWERRVGWREVRLVPDIYYFHYRGYERFLPHAAPRWSDRRNVVFWRGSSTGILGLTSDRLHSLPRYRLCMVAKTLGARADVGISGVVQAVSAAEDALIVRHLEDAGLIRPYVNVTLMSDHRYIVDIDGNANSWNFFQKLRMGCCIIKVDSQYEQWFHPKVLPWVHYVPVKADLSDFRDKVEWAMSHQADAEAIALAGRQLGLATSFDGEMLAAAETLFLG